jgi:hypothetical protein
VGSLVKLFGAVLLILLGLRALKEASCHENAGVWEFDRPDKRQNCEKRYGIKSSEVIRVRVRCASSVAHE